MSNTNPQLKALFAATHLEVRAESFTLLRLPLSERRRTLLALTSLVAEEQPLALMIEPSEISVMLPSEEWAQLTELLAEAVLTIEDDWRMLTLRVTVPLDVSGYLAPLAGLLAEAGVPLYVVAAYSTDHIFVHGPQTTKATEILQNFFKQCAEDK